MSPQALAPSLGAVADIALWALAPFVLAPLALLAGGRLFAEIAEPVTQVVEWTSDAAEHIAQALLVALLLAVGVTVAMRYVFGVSSTGLGEAALYAHALAFLLAAPAALGRDAHVRVDVFYARFTPVQKAWVNLAAYTFLAAPMLIAILHFSGPYVAASWRIGERSVEADGLPILFLVKTAIPVFAVLLLAQAIAEACRAAATIRGLAPAPARFAPDGERPA